MWGNPEWKWKRSKEDPKGKRNYYSCMLGKMKKKHNLITLREQIIIANILK